MKKILIVIFILLLAISFLNCNNGNTQETDNEDESDNAETNADSSNELVLVDLDKGQELVEARCSVCHTTDKVYDAEYKDKEDWNNLVERMVGKGAKLNDDEKETVVSYLYYEYGERLVDNRCTQCHTKEKIYNASYDEEKQWSNVVERMIGKGAKLNDEEKSVVVDHLYVYSLIRENQ